MKKYTIAIGIAVLLCAGIFCVAGQVDASGKWKNVAIYTDKDNYFQGESAEYTIVPVTDTGTTDLINIVIYNYYYPLGKVAQRWDNQTPNDPTKVTWAIPDEAAPGAYYIYVFESGGFTPINKDSNATGTIYVHQSASIYPELKFDKGSYLSGDTIHLSVNVIISGKTTVSGPFICNYTVDCGGITTESNDRGTEYTFDTDINYKGKIDFDIVVTDQSYEHRGSKSASVQVDWGILLVNPNKKEFRAGDTVTVTYSLITRQMTSPEYLYEITNANSNLVFSSDKKSGTPSGGLFTFTVPTNPSNSYTMEVFAEDGDMKVSGACTINRYDDLLLFIKITTPSKYVTGTYEPGETISIHYEISATGNNKLPSTYTIYYGITDRDQNKPSILVTNASKGDVSYTIPSDVQDGNPLFEMDAVVGGSTCHALQTIPIKSGPSALQMNIGGMSLMDLILMLMLIIIIIIILIQIFKARKKAKQVPPPPPPATPPQQVVYVQQPMEQAQQPAQQQEQQQQVVYYVQK